MEVKDSQPTNAAIEIYLRLLVFGKVTDRNFLQLLNAEFPMEIKDSGKDMSVNALHCQKALFAITVSVSGRTTEDKSPQKLKAYSPMVVTVNLLLLTFIDDGMMTSPIYDGFL